MTITKILPSYVYQQYHDDENIVAVSNAINEYGQEYFDYSRDLKLFLYTDLSGDLLDWVGSGLYGIERPVLSIASYAYSGEYNTTVYNGLIPFNGMSVTTESEATYTVTDDIYKRILTWHVYKADGHVFTIPWLKRRIKRFLLGTNGEDVSISNTDDISVTVSNHTVTINASLTTYTDLLVFSAAVSSGAVELPFQYDFNVTYTYDLTSNLRFNNVTNSAYAGAI